jgi:hypothetical protein
MNGVNAALFALVGSAMELLPRLFPASFPPSGADQASARALWLSAMGVLQIGLGLAYLVRLHVVPFATRAVAAIRTGERGSLALSNPRAVSGR